MKDIQDSNKTVTLCDEERSQQMSEKSKKSCAMEKKLVTDTATKILSLKEILGSKECKRTHSSKNREEPEEKYDPKNSGSNKISKLTQTDHDSKVPQTDEEKAIFYAKEVGLFALKTAAISGAVLGGVALVVPALGFAAGGVAAGSLAAAYQSAFLGGTIASGSAFAVLQSIGAAGLAVSTQVGVCAASATASGLHSICRILKKKTNEDEKDDPKETDEEQVDENEESDKDQDNIKEKKDSKN
ncbi:hypothetical protein NPIL_507701 [Nephila pilipes]|uniref:Uncharacterized protein n=2 Tax=Nephila pilipes TaxID=299642 RepID=A0A8X6NXA5_NEPPI|nr:hypothetical protein NPIL_507701 [Nephila pilipes]